MPVSPCCYFTSFEIVTARYGLPYLKAEGFWGNITIFASQMRKKYIGVHRPLVTFNNLWDENNILYNPRSHHMGMYAKNDICIYIFTFWLFFYLYWPLMTSKVKLSWSLLHSVVAYSYLLKNAYMDSFSNVDLFLTCFDLDLYWPLMTFEVKIS